MKEIKFTEDRKEMVELGKVLFAENPSIYTPAIIKGIQSTIVNNMINNSEDEKRNMFYQSVYDYWAYGISASEEFYLGLKDKSHEERLEYIPYRWRLRYTWQINKRQDEHLLGNKYETYQLLKPFFLRDVIELKDSNDYSKFVNFIDKHKEFVVKPTGLSCGLGVYKVNILEHKDMSRLFESILHNGKNSADDFKWQSLKSVVLEELIDQSPELALIHPYSVNGIRVTTMRIGNKYEIIYPWFKVGANHSFVTSAVLGTYDAGIDATTGIVNTDGFKENGASDPFHPDTGIPFKGYQIPKWTELLDTVKEVADRFQTINYVGWDMVLTKKGWCVMEGNFSGDYMWQMFLHKGYSKELKELTGWTRDSDYWWNK